MMGYFLKKFLCGLFVCICVFYNTYAFAFSAETTQNLNFGTYIQTSTSASGVLSYNSAVSSLSGLTSGTSSEKQSATIRIQSTKGRENVDAMMKTSSVTLANTPGCTIIAKSFTFSSSWITVRNNDPVDLNIGTTISISGGFCEEGTYSGTATVELDGKDYETVNFTVQITLEAPLSIDEVTGMNFETILSPSTNSTITITPSGSYTQSGGITFIDNDLNAGEFIVTGVGNRQVTITLPSSTVISNGTQSMTVNNFTSNPSNSFTLSGTGTGKTQNVKIGATLHINAHQKAGNYTGTYPVIVSY